MIFIICSLAVWRVTAALCYEKSFGWLREKAKTHMLGEDDQPITVVGKILSCFWCTSWLVAPLFAAICSYQMRPRLSIPLYWLALSGAAILLNHVSRVAAYAERG